MKSTAKRKSSKKAQKPIRTKGGKAVLTTVILLTSALILIGVYALGSNLDIFGNDASSSIESAAPSESSSYAPASSAAATPTLTAVPTAVPTSAPTATPKPTFPPVSPGSLSNARLGWSYSPSGTEGVPATTNAARIALCTKYGGIWQADTSVPKVYITMDIGYEYNGNTTKILNIAKEKNFKISFFVVGNLFAKDSLKPVFKRMYNEGHLIASHSWNHPMYWKMFAESGRQGIADDLRKVEDAYFGITGTALKKYMRFPSGEYSEATLNVMRELGYTPVFWSFAYRDWLIKDQPDPETSLKYAVKGLHNGAVLLLHTVSNTNVEILPELVDEIRARGYEIALLDEIG